MRAIKSIRAVALAGALTLAMAGCGEGGGDTAAGGDTTGPLKLGIVIPQSGTFAQAGQEVKRGYELALAAADGRAGGRPVELVFGDAGTPEGALAEAERLGTVRLTEERV